MKSIIVMDKETRELISTIQELDSEKIIGVTKDGYSVIIDGELLKEVPEGKAPDNSDASKRATVKQMSKPIQEWLRHNANPYTNVVISDSGIKIMTVDEWIPDIEN